MKRYKLISNNQITNIALFENNAEGTALASSLGYVSADDADEIYSPDLTDDELAVAVKDIRNELLQESDYIITRHRDQVAEGITTTITDAIYQSWLTYRQALRDVPTQTGYPSTVTWPTKP